MKNNPRGKNKAKKIESLIRAKKPLEISQEKEAELFELDRIAKMLVRRDLELSEVREKREQEIEELKRKTRELEDARKALTNMLGDVDEARRTAENEKNKTVSIINNFADGLFVFDEKNILSLANPRAEIFFGITATNLIGRTFSELRDIEPLRPLINLIGRELKVIFRKELSTKESLCLEVSTTSMMRGKERLGTLVILHDITREKIIERMKTEFVSLVAHQLRTPLSAIEWTLRMLLDGDLGAITSEQREFIEKTYSSNERMIHLINDLLNVARIEEGKYLNKPTLASIESVIQFVVDLYKEEMGKRKLTLEFKKPKEKLPKVILDVEKMRLGIQNFLDNAIRYTRPGGKVTILINRGKREIEVAIRDTGVGIPEAQKARVFTKFFRGANAIRMETEGTGLGLFITKNIIETHGGRTWFESEENKGATFYFTLPFSGPGV